MLKIGREKNERRIVVGRRLFFKIEEMQYNIKMVFVGGRWVNMHDLMYVGRVSNVELSGSSDSILDFELLDYDAM